MVEDEQPLAGYIAAGLRKHGCVVDVAFDGRVALEKWELVPYDVVVLDRDLPVLRAAGVTLDPSRRTAERDGRLLQLTPKEFGVLEQLLAAGGAVISAETLLDKVWDENADPFTNAVRITVGTLRRKLGEPQILHTVTGAGYRIAP